MWPPGCNPTPPPSLSLGASEHRHVRADDNEALTQCSPGPRCKMHQSGCLLEPVPNLPFRCAPERDQHLAINGRCAPRSPMGGRALSYAKALALAKTPPPRSASSRGDVDEGRGQPRSSSRRFASYIADGVTIASNEFAPAPSCLCERPPGQLCGSSAAPGAGRELYAKTKGGGAALAATSPALRRARPCATSPREAHGPQQASAARLVGLLVTGVRARH